MNDPTTLALLKDIQRKVSSLCDENGMTPAKRLADAEALGVAMAQAFHNEQTRIAEGKKAHAQESSTETVEVESALEGVVEMVDKLDKLSKQKPACCSKEALARLCIELRVLRDSAARIVDNLAAQYGFNPGR